MILLIVSYHYVSDTAYPLGGIYPVTPARFEAQREELARWFEFVSLQDIDLAVRGEKSLPERSVLIAFDDGLAEQYHNAWPILQRWGTKAAFFVNTASYVEQRVASVHQLHWLRAHFPPDELREHLEESAVEVGVEIPRIAANDERLKQYRYDTPENAALKYALNFSLARSARETLVERCFSRLHPDPEEVWRELYMTQDALSELAAAGCLGTHSHHHLPLATLSKVEIRKELLTSLQLLEEFTRVRPFAIGYPYGGRDAVSRKVAQVAVDVGLRLGMTTERALNRSLDQPLLLARCDTNDAPAGKQPLFEMTPDGIVATAGFHERRHIYFQEPLDHSEA